MVRSFPLHILCPYVALTLPLRCPCVLFLVHGSQEPLSPQTRTFDYEDGKRKNGAEFVVLEVDSKAQVKDQDLKSATPKESDNRKN